jgi:hypothetical protein
MKGNVCKTKRHKTLCQMSGCKFQNYLSHFQNYLPHLTIGVSDHSNHQVLPCRLYDFPRYL